MVGSPGDPLHAQVRAISPDSGQWSDSAWTKLDTVIPGVALLYTNPEAQTNLSVSRAGGVAVADPVFQEAGTRTSLGGTSSSTVTSVIANVASGDLVVFGVQRELIAQITGVSGNGAGLTSFTLLHSCSINTGNFGYRLYAAIATSAAASVTITASFSAAAAYGEGSSARYNNGGSIVGLTPLAVGNAYGTTNATHATSTDREMDPVTVDSGKRALLLAGGTEYNLAGTVLTAQNSWAKRFSSTTEQWLFDRVVDPGTYAGTGTGNRIATAGVSDQYIGVIVALEINAGGSADLNPDFLMPATILQAVNTSNW